MLVIYNIENTIIYKLIKYASIVFFKIGFWFEIARPQVHGYDMNTVSSISPTLYVSAGDEKVARLFTITKSFIKMFCLDKRIPTRKDLILSDCAAEGSVFYLSKN